MVCRVVRPHCYTKAIDKAAANGGGTIAFAKGVYLSGSLKLKSNVGLHLEKGAVLLGGTNPLDYHQLNRWKALILADGQNNIAISGEGTIDGQGLQVALNADSLYHFGILKDPNYNFRRKRVSEYERPQIIEIVKCKNVSVTGVNIRNSSCWVQTCDLCENLIVENPLLKKNGPHKQIIIKDVRNEIIDQKGIVYGIEAIK